MGLKAMIAGKEEPPADEGVEVRRCVVWRPVVILVVLVACGASLFDRLVLGNPTFISGKSIVALALFPVGALWWLWNVIQAIRFRRSGTFGWAISSSHFLFSPPAGEALELPLAAIERVRLVKAERVGVTVELNVSGMANGEPVTLAMLLGGFDENDLALYAMRPSSPRELYRGLKARLKVANPLAKVSNDVDFEED